MAQIISTYTQTQILYREISTKVYSSDAREKREGLRAPHVWHYERDYRPYNVYSETAEERIAGINKLVEEIRREFGGDEEPRYELRPMTATFYESGSQAWQNREQKKVESGLYILPPWQRAPWYAPLAALHYTHLSLKQLGKIAFTMSPEHGEANRQTIISPGKYLLRFFGDWLNQGAVDQYCAAIDTQTKHLSTPVQFARTSEEIVHVYQNGPSSCMSKENWHSDYRTGGIHPVTPYGAGDLAVAYFSDERKNIRGRCIAWPEKKIYGRLYGDAARLQILLSRDGYEFAGDRPSEWNGARLLKIRVENGSGFVCPYLDIGGQSVEITDKYIIVNTDGEYQADQVSAVIGGDGCSSNEDDDDTFTCDGCSDRISGDSWSYNGDGCYCQGCWNEDYFHCVHCDNDFTHDERNIVHTHGRADLEICDNCLESVAYLCENCEEYHWVQTRRRSSSVVAFVKSIFFDADNEHTTQGYCERCVDNRYVVRRDCGHYAPMASDTTCFCGAPDKSAVVETPLRTHRVTVDGGIA